MRIKVRAPATIANFGPGFDVFGICLKAPYDILELETFQAPLADFPKIEIFYKETLGDKELAKKKAYSESTAGCAAFAVIEAFIKKYSSCETQIKSTGMRIIISKGIRPGSGLGSSAASAAGAAVGTHELLKEITGRELDRISLAKCAAQGEKAAGGVHPDNTTPAVFGGFTVAFAPQIKYETVEWEEIQHWRFRRALSRSFNRGFERFEPPKMYLSIVFPKISLPTKEMRQLLKELKDERAPGREAFVKNVDYVKGVVKGFERGDLALICENLKDEIVTPVRKKKIPYFDAMEKAAIGAGAKAFILCGSGPSVAAISGSEQEARGVLRAMYDVYGDKNLLKPYGTTCFVAEPNPKGVEVLKFKK